MISLLKKSIQEDNNSDNNSSNESDASFGALDPFADISNPYQNLFEHDPEGPIRLLITNLIFQLFWIIFKRYPRLLEDYPLTVSTNRQIFLCFRHISLFSTVRRRQIYFWQQLFCTISISQQNHFWHQEYFGQ